MSDLPFAIGDRYAPRGWTTLSDAYGDLAIDGVPGGELHQQIMRFASTTDADEGSFLAALNIVIWEALSQIRRFALFDGKNLDLVLLSPAEHGALLQPDPVLGKTFGYNRLISLSHGTIGSGAEDFGPASWEAFEGATVLVSKVEWAAAIRAVGLSSSEQEESTTGDEWRAERVGREILQNAAAVLPKKEELRQAIKERTGKQLSGKAWGRVWRRLSRAFPDLKKPGRPRNQNLTPR